MKRMKYSKVATLAPVSLLIIAALNGALAADEMTASFPVENHFQSGLWETSVGAGVLFSPFIATQTRLVLNYGLTEIQLGYMLTNPRGPAFWRGNFQAVGDAFGGPIVAGQGSYVSGVTAWLRYNFVPRDSRLVPFAQAGAGLTGTDLDRRIEGDNFNFNLDLGVGVRYFVAQNWSVNLEYRFQHISNANLYYPNVGVNAQGPMVSVSWLF
jgi:opacity protein-like surface antigen